MVDRNNNPSNHKSDKMFPAKSQQPMKWRHILLLLAVTWLMTSLLFRGFGLNNVMEISYSEFKDNIRKGRVAEVTLKGREVTGNFKNPVEGKTKKGLFGKSTLTYENFKTVIPVIEDPGLMEILKENEVVIHAEPDERSLFSTLLITLLPWILIIGFFCIHQQKNTGENRRSREWHFRFRKIKGQAVHQVYQQGDVRRYSRTVKC